MYPAYNNMQLVMINKRERSFSNGDVIAFRCQSLDSVLVKRIVAGPGDSVVVKDRALIVNGFESPYYSGVSFDYAGILENEIHLKEDEFAVIGDNVANSKDSRYRDIGIVSLEDILGDIIS